MIPHRIQLRDTGTVIVLLLVSILVGAPAGCQPRVATVDSVESTVSVKRGSKTQVVHRGDPLYGGDSVTIDASGGAWIHFTDGSDVRLYRNTQIEILPPKTMSRRNRVLFQLVRGECSLDRIRPGTVVLTPRGYMSGRK
jgi:hypothetical protein